MRTEDKEMLSLSEHFAPTAGRKARRARQRKKGRSGGAETALFPKTFLARQKIGLVQGVLAFAKSLIWAGMAQIAYASARKAKPGTPFAFLGNLARILRQALDLVDVVL